MNRRWPERLADVTEACRVIDRYVGDAGIPEEVVLDAIRMRLVEIGEAVRSLPADLVALEPGIPWARIAELSNRLTTPSADRAPAIVLGTARQDVPRLLAATERLLVALS